VVLRVVVDKEAGLQEFVRREADAGHHTRRRERHLPGCERKRGSDE
jgi:hypothetical protein